VATRDYDGYDALVKKESSLSALVRNLNTIALEDSVQKLAALDRATLNARIDELIALEREKRQLEQDRREEERLDRQYATQVASENRSSGTGSQWYFYNETAKSLGYNEFKVVWGNRPLEDHWQRSDKTALAFATENGGVQTEEAADEITEAVTAGNPLSRDYYMAAIPLTDSAKAASNTRVENSLYESGLIYMK
jgi:hypothetical protein